MIFTMQTQQMDLWCWAAVAASTESCFRPHTARSQCDIATLLKNTACCPQVPVCDEADSLRNALDSVGCLGAFVEGRISWVRVHNQLLQGFPVGARIEWPNGGGHFVVLTGASVSSEGEGLLEVSNPSPDNGDFELIPYKEFALAYQSFGVWTHTYLLRP